MKISNEKPPIWEECKKVFKLVKGTVFTYGDTIYNPDGVEISDDLLIHEKCHAKQQEYNNTVAHIWWINYLEDSQFRLEQEVAAYAAQYRFICAKYKDRNKRDQYLGFMARILSSPLYGCPITQYGARKAIEVGRLTTEKVV